MAKKISDMFPDFGEIIVKGKSYKISTVKVKEISNFQKEIDKQNRLQYIEIARELGLTPTVKEVMENTSSTDETYDTALKDPRILCKIIYDVVLRLNENVEIEAEDIMEIFDESEKVDEIMNIIFGKYIEKEKVVSSSKKKVKST